MSQQTEQNRSCALIFRKRILPYSETFIAKQGKHLQEFSPVFAGYSNELSGIGLLKGEATSVLENHSSLPQIAKQLIRPGLWFNKAWLTELNSFKPQLIHAHFGPDGMEARFLAAKLGIPLITTFHGYDITVTQKRTQYLNKLPKLFSACDQVIAVSDFIKEKLVERGCPENKIIQHYIGIDIEQFSANKQETDAPSILFVGRLTQKKGCLHLLNSLKVLQKQFPELKTTIIGDGPLQNQMIKIVTENNLNVEFLGSQSQDVVKEKMCASWIFCVPSIVASNGDAEGLGMVFLEAQSLEIPVVSLATGGIPEAVTHGVSGLLASEENMEELTDFLSQLLVDRNLRTNLGKAGRKRVEKHFDINRQCEKLETIYRGII